MRIVKALGLIALLAVFIAFPFVFSNPAVTIIAVLTIVYAAAATGWNIFSGYSGYIALGHAAYFGIGSYAIALMAQDWNVPAGYAPFFLVPLAGLVAAVFAVPFGWIALRTRRHTFLLIPIATFFIMQFISYNFLNTTNSLTVLTLPLPLYLR